MKEVAVHYASSHWRLLIGHLDQLAVAHSGSFQVRDYLSNEKVEETLSR
jgi:hypothetical protein